MGCRDSLVTDQVWQAGEVLGMEKHKTPFQNHTGSAGLPQSAQGWGNQTHSRDKVELDGLGASRKLWCSGKLVVLHYLSSGCTFTCHFFMKHAELHVGN